MDLKDKDGKPISTEGIEPKTLAVIQAMHASTQQQFTTLTESLPSKADLTETLGGITASIDELKKAKADDPKDPPADPKTGDDATAAVIAKLDKLDERITSLTTEREAEKASATSRSIAHAFIDDKYPNLKGRDVLQKRIAEGNVKTPEEAQKIADRYLEEIKSFGVDVAKLTSDPEDEGGKTDEGDEKEVRRQELKEQILKQAGVAPAA